MTENYSIQPFHFKRKHFLMIFTVTLILLALGTVINTLSRQNILHRTSNFYRHTSIENMADLTTTSLELLLDQVLSRDGINSDNRQNLIHAFDMILSQHRLKENIQEICVIVNLDSGTFAIDNGTDLFHYFSSGLHPDEETRQLHKEAVDIYEKYASELKQFQDITSYIDESGNYRVLIPVILHGNYSAILYMHIAQDYRGILNVIQSSYSTLSMIFTSLIILGLLAMFYLSSYMISERDLALRKLFETQHQQMIENVELQKEQHFARRIYHTHHKAEKIMGLIKDDLRSLPDSEQNEIIQRTVKYASFVQRVIYDMKSYNPPVSTIRNRAFSSDINEILRFLTENIFKRMLKGDGEDSGIILDLHAEMQPQPVNEYVIWEILEPLIFNSLNHCRVKDPVIRLQTRRDSDSGCSFIIISDNGRGIPEEFLEKNGDGIQKIFLEQVSSRDDKDNSGYGCYIARQMCLRCGWHIRAFNAGSGGAVIEISFCDGAGETDKQEKSVL